MSKVIETPTVRARETQQITTRTDSREILANAKRDIERYKGMMEATKDAPFNEIHLEYGANSPETGYEIGSQVIPKY